MANLLQENYPTQKRVLRALQDLPDEKVPAKTVCSRVVELYKDVDEVTPELHGAIQDLILLGEVELCQERATGGRVWLKRRDTLESSPDREVERRPVSSVWMCYTAKDYRDRKAIRLFMSREQALEHLGESVVVDPNDYQEVPYLNGVWYVEREGSMDSEGFVAVVRREPIYSLVQQSR